jgi:hypothetical protein
MDSHRATSSDARDASLARLLIAATALVALAGLAAEVGEHVFGLSEITSELFSLSYERNVPTWYATVLLFACSALLAQIARRAPSHRAHWWALSAIFAYMSLDEAIEIHEHLGRFVEGEGVLYFAWVIPAGVVVLALGLAYLPFVRALEPKSRRRFLLAGALYVGGALLMELPLGYWTDRHGDDNLGYGLIDFVEETMELAGAAVFVHALADHRARLGASS